MEALPMTTPSIVRNARSLLARSASSATFHSSSCIRESSALRLMVLLQPLQPLTGPVQVRIEPQRCPILLGSLQAPTLFLIGQAQPGPGLRMGGEIAAVGYARQVGFELDLGFLQIAAGDDVGHAAEEAQAWIGGSHAGGCFECPLQGFQVPVIGENLGSLEVDIGTRC